MGTAHYQEIKLDMGVGGSSNPFTGTVDEFTNLVGGTITKVEGGTIGNLASGSVVVTAGTIGGFGEIGTLNVLEDGTISEVGTVTGMGVLADGTISEVGTVTGIGVIADGTVVVGTVPGIGVVADGSVVVTAGTVSKLLGGTVGNLASGSVVVTDGTIGDMDTIGTVGVLEDGTVAVTFDADIPGGTVDLVTRTGKVGTVENLDGGTIGVVSSLGTIDGTIENIGTVHNIGTIGVINDGTIVTTIGDISGGTIDILTSGTLAEVSNVVDGTIAEITSVTEVVNLAGGTVDVLADGTVAVTFDADVPGGTVDLVTRTGNLGTVENLDGGTVDVLADGTVSEVGTVTGVGVLAGGTVQIDTNPVQLTETWGTLVDAAGAEFGTLLESSGAGTYHYIEGMSIVCHSGTVDCYLGYGSAITGTGVIARGIFSEGGGGIARDFKNALYGGGTNTEVIYKIGGAGTVMYTINYRTGT